jgi:glycine betaine/choline ABC-type transport system substrate-binding protein
MFKKFQQSFRIVYSDVPKLSNTLKVTFPTKISRKLNMNHVSNLFKYKPDFE